MLDPNLWFSMWLHFHMQLAVRNAYVAAVSGKDALLSNGSNNYHSGMIRFKKFVLSLVCL